MTYAASIRGLIQWVRRTILENLDSAHPFGMPQNDIIAGLASPILPVPIDPADTLKDFDYLAQLGLIFDATAPDEIAAWQLRVRDNALSAGPRPVRWKLTAKGKNFIEKSMPWDRIEQF